MVTVKDRQIPWRENMTLRDALREIGYDVPAIIVRVDGRTVRRREWDTCLLEDNARVHIHRMAVGG
jgi:thiamine biosynthesis protein ThiS